MVRTAIFSFLLLFSLASAKGLVVKNCGEKHIANQYGFVVKSCSAGKKVDMLKQLKEMLEDILKEKKYGKKQ